MCDRFIIEKIYAGSHELSIRLSVAAAVFWAQRLALTDCLERTDMRSTPDIDFVLTDSARMIRAAASRFADEVRLGHCATCEHCSWRNSETFRL